MWVWDQRARNYRGDEEELNAVSTRFRSSQPILGLVDDPPSLSGNRSTIANANLPSLFLNQYPALLDAQLIGLNHAAILPKLPTTRFFPGYSDLRVNTRLETENQGNHALRDHVLHDHDHVLHIPNSRHFHHQQIEGVGPVRRMPIVPGMASPIPVQSPYPTQIPFFPSVTSGSNYFFPNASRCRDDATSLLLWAASRQVSAMNPVVTQTYWPAASAMMTGLRRDPDVISSSDVAQGRQYLAPTHFPVRELTKYKIWSWRYYVHVVK